MAKIEVIRFEKSNGDVLTIFSNGASEGVWEGEACLALNLFVSLLNTWDGVVRALERGKHFSSNPFDGYIAQVNEAGWVNGDAVMVLRVLRNQGPLDVFSDGTMKGVAGEYTNCLVSPVLQATWDGLRSYPHGGTLVLNTGFETEFL